METLKIYYRLTKPGIIYGNILSILAGYFLAFSGNLNLILLFAVICGASLVMASGCVINNYIDRNIDAVMARTKNRGVPQGLVSKHAVITFGTILGIAGVVILYLFVNLLTTLLGVFAWLSYVVFYGVSKRRSIHGTLVGAVPGAMPPLAGYCAVTNQLDLGALILFLILVFWQMPHFYAIAIRRIEEYSAASIPAWPIKKGVESTKNQMVGYGLLFVLSVSALTLFNYTGYIYLAIMLLVSLWWLRIIVKRSALEGDKVWAKQVFLSSLVILPVFTVAILLDVVIR